MMLLEPSDEEHAGLRQGDLHHVPREVAGEVARVLPGRGDAAERGVVVDAEMRAPHAAGAGGHQRAAAPTCRPAPGSTAASRSSTPGAGCCVSASAAARARRRRATTASTCAGVITFGTVIAKLSGSRLPVLHERGDEQVERAQAARVQLVRHRLDADADERRQRAGDHAGGDFLRCRLRVAIFLGVGPRAVAVLEIETEILDRFALELGEDALADGVRPSTRGPPPWRRPTRVGANSSSVAMAAAPKVVRRFAPEGIGTADQRVDRLPCRRRRLDTRRRASCWRVRSRAAMAARSRDGIEWASRRLR